MPRSRHMNGLPSGLTGRRQQLAATLKRRLFRALRWPRASGKHVMTDTFKNVASARINRTESGGRFVAICVAANCGPTGMKPAETFLEPLQTREQKLRKRILLRTRNHEFRIKSQDTSIFDIPCSVFNIQKRPKVSVIWLTPTARRFSNRYFGVRLGH